MGELVSDIPKEAQQIRNVLSAVKDVIEAPVKPKRFQSITLLGFSAVVPEQVKASEILANPQRIKVVDTAEQYMIGLNDRLDYEGSGKKDIEDLVSEIRQREQARKLEVDKALEGLPEVERIRAQKNIETATTEVEFVENWIREKRDAENITFSDINIYRNVVNSISNVSLSSIIFGPGNLENRVRPINGDMSIQSLIDKYAWVSGRVPQNEIERGVMIAHNVAMAIQIVDDWKGRDIDRVLNIPTYALSVLRSVGDDERVAKVWLYDEKDKYIERANELGLGKVGTGAVLKFITLAENAHNWIAKTGRKHGWARRILEGKNMGRREKDYMTRKI